MSDPSLILRLFTSVLESKIRKYGFSESEVRSAVNSLVYGRPSLESNTVSHVADFTNPLHRCAYLYKCVPLHTSLVMYIVKKAVALNREFFANILAKSEFRICSLGGGPGNDLIGVLGVLNREFALNKTVATIVDYVPEWKETFDAVVHELRCGKYDSMSDAVNPSELACSYIGADLIGTLKDNVRDIISFSDLVVMVKFVSAAACKHTGEMIENIFKAMRPGSAVLFIDNAGGGFRQLTTCRAQNCGMEAVFSPIKHLRYTRKGFKTNKYGKQQVSSTQVSIQMWSKPPCQNIERNQASSDSINYNSAILANNDIDHKLQQNVDSLKCLKLQ